MSDHMHHLRIQYQIHWESPWHVGSGAGSVGVDRLLRTRVAKVQVAGQDQSILVRVPYVPGSQIKGVLRHLCERLCVAAQGTAYSPHVIGPEPPLPILQEFRPAEKSEDLVNRLFGSRYDGECLLVSDALPVEVPEAFALVYGRTAIDRLVGTVRGGHLFFTQVAVKYLSPLQGEIVGRHPREWLTQDGDNFPYEYAVLVAALLTLDCLGGDKSAGFGQCRVTISNIAWNDCPQFTLAEALKPLEESDWGILVNLVREQNSK